MNDMETADTAITAKAVEVSQGQVSLEELLALVAAGQEVILMRGQAPFARMLPIAPGSNKRVPGLHTDAAWISNDFNDPLPDDFWAD